MKNPNSRKKQPEEPSPLVKEKDIKEKDMTLYYMMESINVMVENEKILLSRIKKLEEAVDMIAERVYEDEDDDEERIIN